MIDNANEKTISLKEFYSKKCIFITGATGFLGKVLIERLLALFYDLDVIYILIRGKRGSLAQKRLDALLECPIYSKLPENWKKKIIPIEGDLGESNMSMSEEDRLLLIDRVEVVFHCAATVRFDEKLDTAIKINVFGTNHIVALCKEMKNLKALLHVSTAFSNCDKSFHIEEKFYEPGMNINEAITFLNLADKKALDIVTPRLTKDYANTYAYTKSAAEDIFKNEGKSLPVAIFRPGIITGATDKYSFPGFVDNFYGPSGMVLGVGMGVLKTIRFNANTSSHVIPVDYCVNVMLAATCDIAQRKYDSPPIYNYTPPLKDDINWQDFVSYCLKIGEQYPTSDGIWWPAVRLTENKIMHNIIFLFLHILPAVFVDTILRIIGKKPMLLGIQRKVYKSQQVLEYYLRGEWTFQLDGVIDLNSRLSPKDREYIYMDMTSFDWKSYIYAFIHGLSVYLKIEDPNRLPQSRKRLQRLKYIHYITIIVFAGMGLYFIWNFLENYILRTINDL